MNDTNKAWKATVAKFKKLKYLDLKIGTVLQ